MENEPNNDNQPAAEEERPIKPTNPVIMELIDCVNNFGRTFSKPVGSNEDHEPVVTILDIIKNVFKVAILCFFGVNVIIGALAAFCHMCMAGICLLRFRIWDTVNNLFAVAIATGLVAAFLMLDMWFRKNHAPDWTVFKRKGKRK